MINALTRPGSEVADRADDDATASLIDSVEMGEGQFRLLADNLPTLCWMAKPDGYIFWYNKRWHEYCGSTPEQMEGWGWQSVHDPAMLPTVLERWAFSLSSGEAFEMTFPLRGADGLFRPFLTRVQPVRYKDGAIAWWFGVNTDITPQIEVERQLKEANARLHEIAAERDAMLSQLSEGVIITDPSGNIVFVNDAAARLHGRAEFDVPPEDYVSTYGLMTLDGLPHPFETLPLRRAVLKDETVVDAHWRVRRPDGSEVLAIGNAQPFYGPGGDKVGAVLTIRDDTERQANMEALSAALDAREMLLNEVNHRVKNSLQLVTSLLMLQASQTDSATVRKSLLEARARINVVASVHKRLYTSAEHDRVDLPTYLHELATETVGALNNGGHVELRFESEEKIIIPLDLAVPIALLISELLTNAMKYAFGGAQHGIITITTKIVGDDINIVLSDNGCGLPEKFDPATSTGLGMRIVMALTEQIRGRLEVLRPAVGAGFSLVLPVSNF